MIRFLLTTAFALAVAFPALAQQPARPRETDEVARLKAEVQELEAKLKKEGEKKEEGNRDEWKKKEKNSEAKKDEPKKDDPKKPNAPRPPMGGPGGPPEWGGIGGFGGPPMGSCFGGGPATMGGGVTSGRNPLGMLIQLPGFQKLSKQEQQMLTGLIDKVAELSKPTPPAATTTSTSGPGGGNSVEARLERREKSIEEIKNALRQHGGSSFPSGSGSPGGRGGR